MPLWPLLLALVAVIVYAVSDWLGGAPPDAADVGPPPPQYLAQGTVWQRFDAQGALDLRARASDLRGYQGGRIELDGILLERLGSEQRWQLQSPHGDIPPGAERLRLQGPVLGTVLRGDAAPLALDAGVIWVDRRRRELSSEEPLRLESPDRYARAEGFTADWQASRITLIGNVEVQHDALR
jgi:LPS export ABC transporter protein LptC